MICVVEQPVDVLSLERTHEYRGLYHVLGGALSPLDGVEPGDLRIQRLMERVGADGVEEVVLATNPTMTGEATAAYLADRLRDRVTVTRLASGLPVGGDLEYADEVTLGRALAGRTARLSPERARSVASASPLHHRPSSPNDQRRSRFLRRRSASSHAREASQPALGHLAELPARFARLLPLARVNPSSSPLVDLQFLQD